MGHKGNVYTGRQSLVRTYAFVCLVVYLVPSLSECVEETPLPGLPLPRPASHPMYALMICLNTMRAYKCVTHLLIEYANWEAYGHPSPPQYFAHNTTANGHFPFSKIPETLPYRCHIPTWLPLVTTAYGVCCARDKCDAVAARVAVTVALPEPPSPKSWEEIPCMVKTTKVKSSTRLFPSLAHSRHHIPSLSPRPPLPPSYFPYPFPYCAGHSPHTVFSNPTERREQAVFFNGVNPCIC